uniref:cytoplasmic dynein 2 heavy chain 1-like n=1 Tax=Ciona intestinalis TaxID=7719 RepID=UPI000EF542FF|nr:cytoplasmic dynein 2 heavy chain 1-like [Ciona intestinalis]|eukprot:XP_026695415.1 cytoplasmic dynein 2 heavy chain 1-like [Ciona intestinalis]
MELVEQLQDSLDDIWKQTEFPAYPEARMLNFLTVIGDELCRFAQRKLDSEFSSIWVGPYIAVREGLRNAVGVCDRWITMCATLTSRIWKQYPSHVWNSGKYKATNVIHSMTRFQEVCDLRTVHEHLLRLLSTTDRERLCPDDILAKTFSKVAALHYNSYTEPVWRSAVATYERAMQPAEDAVAGKLRRRLHDSSGKVHQLLHEFQRYNELIKRPRIIQTLTPERETLLGQLTNYAKNLKSEFREKSRNGTGGGKTSGKNLSEVVSNIIWVRQLEGKLNEILKSSSELLSSLRGFDQFKDMCTKSRDEMNNYRQEQFQSWSEYMLSSLDDINDPISATQYAANEIESNGVISIQIEDW